MPGEWRIRLCSAALLMLGRERGWEKDPPRPALLAKDRPKPFLSQNAPLSGTAQAGCQQPGGGAF